MSEMEKGRDELLAEAVRRALESEPGIGVNWWPGCARRLRS